LEKDENDVPKILTMIYQELFPTFFLLSKTMNVSCPPHQIGAMGDTLEKDVGVSDEKETPEAESTQETPETESTQETPEAESTQETPVESEADVQNDSEELEKPDVVQ